MTLGGGAGESPGGVSPPGARRTRREPLSSPGSHRPAIRAHTPAPVSEQARLAACDVSDEPARPGLVAAQAFVFPHGPPHEHLVEVAKDRIQHGLVEASRIVDPALDLTVEHQRQVREGLVRPASDAPAAHLAPHPRLRLARYRRREVHEVLPEPALRQPRSERVRQEVKRRVLVRATPVGILAVHRASLALVELKPALRQPLRDRGPQLQGLSLTVGMDNHVIAVALELDGRVLPSHPRIQRVMHEHVDEQR